MKKFTYLFKRIDKDTNGIINEAEFRTLVQEMKITNRKSEIDHLWNKVDPRHNRQINYSECVTHFTLEVVRDQKKAESILDRFNSVEDIEGAAAD